jgi:ABC-type nitrate/sulfonate/bicarbonate transport system, permease component
MSNSLEAIASPQAAPETNHGTGSAEGQRAVAGGAAKRKSKSSRLAAAILKDIVIGAAIPAVLLILWQIAASAGYISPVFMPSPASILSAFWTLAASDNLVHHLLVSMGRAGLGFLIGGAAGLLLGLLTGLFRKAQYLLDPSFQVLRLIPHLAIAPLIILWFGFGETSKIAIIVTGSFFPLYINTFLGIRNVDNKLFEVSRILGFSPLKRLTGLILPASLPDILIGVRISLAVSWIGLVVAELIGSRAGIGFLINEAKQNSDTSVIFVGIIIFAVIGKLIDSLMKALEVRWLNWRDSYKG